jgi:hypothetical protein
LSIIRGDVLCIVMMDLGFESFEGFGGMAMVLVPVLGRWKVEGKGTEDRIEKGGLWRVWRLGNTGGEL